MADTRIVESGSMGRVAYARIAPNEDLVLGVEKLCLAEGFRNAFVRGGSAASSTLACARRMAVTCTCRDPPWRS